MDRLGPYRVVAPIGAGGMGEVYRAIDERLGRTVAIKLLHARDAASAQMQLRLLREAQAASALDHPGVVTVFDVGVHDQRAYVVMEHVTGDRFSDLAGKLEPAEALRLCAAAADALAAAHDAGILHRDVKSDNLMRTRDGRVKVLDFGLAKLQDGGAAAMATSHPAVATPISADASLDETMRPDDASPSNELTQAGQLIGTPLYMSPEQAEREPVTARSEVYALGVVLYELLTGTVPFRGDDVPGTLDAIRAGALVPPSQRRPSLPRALDPLVVRALARRPAERYDDMAPFAAAMREVADELGGRAPPRIWPVAVAVVAVAGAVVAIMATGKDPPATTPAAVTVDAAPPAASLRLSGLRRLTALDGCEEFPSFADGGRTVVFDGARGDDYVLQAVDVATGAIRQLTDVDGWDWAAQVSPDGTQLAFIRSTEASDAAWVMGYDPPTPPRKLRDGTIKPQWNAHGQVWVGSVRAPALIELAGDRVLRTVEALEGERYNGIAELEDGRLAALVYDAASSQSRGVAFVDAAGRSTMVLATRIDEVLIPVRGGVLTTRLRHEKSELWFLPLRGQPGAVLGADDLQPRKGMAISPAGDLVWSTCETVHETSSLDTGGATTSLRRISGGTWKDAETAPIADTRTMIVVSDRGGANGLWVIDRDGVAPPRPVATGTLEPTDPAASPDGKTIAFAATDGGIYVVPLDASAAPRALTTTPDDVRPSWSADGTEVYYQAGRDGTSTIKAVPVAGGAPRDVIAGGRPEASRDGRVLAYLDHTAKLPMLLDLRTGKSRPLSRQLVPGPYNLIRLTASGKRAAILLAATKLLEVDLATGKLVHQHDAGGDQLSGLAYLGDEIVVTRAIWQGDLWIARGDLVLP